MIQRFFVVFISFVVFSLMMSEKNRASDYVELWEKGTTALEKKRYKKACPLLYRAWNKIEKMQKSKGRGFRGSYNIPNKILFSLAYCLKELDLFYSALFFLDKIVNRGGGKLFFRESVKILRELQAEEAPLDNHTLVSILHNKVNYRNIFAAERSFYTYVVGAYLFNNHEFRAAYGFLKKVRRGSEYYFRARFYIGIMYGVSKQYLRAVQVYKGLLASIPRSKKYKNFRELIWLNLARIYYEKKQFKKAISYYSMIEEGGDNWLTALFEASWAFFRIGKHNNTLGNIHTIRSPYFGRKFYPEVIVLESITYLYLCYFKRSRLMLKEFNAQYGKGWQGVKRMVRQFRPNPALLYSYLRSAPRSPYIGPILNQLKRSESYIKTQSIFRNIKDEKEIINEMSFSFRDSTLAKYLLKKLANLTKLVRKRMGDRLLAQLVDYSDYLQDLKYQTELITVQALESRLIKLEESIIKEKRSVSSRIIWGEGMKPLNLKERHEFWPFDGEYWLDELGGYAYNIESRCKSSK